jgi:HK97 family phage prohead protease
MSALERKFLDLKAAGIAVVAEDGLPVTVTGYGSTFDATPDCYGDLIAPGAYRATIADWMARSYAMPMLLEHGQATVGKWLAMSEDAHGLLLRGELTPGHSVAADAAASLRHGAVTGLSIGFRPTEWQWDDKTGVRTLTGIDLYEVSLVSTPANSTARVTGVKALAEMGEAIQTTKDFERFLRDTLGWPRGLAKAVAVEGFKTGANAATARSRETVPADDAGTGGETAEPRDGAAESANRLVNALKGLRLTAPPHSGNAP